MLFTTSLEQSLSVVASDSRFYVVHYPTWVRHTLGYVLP